MSITLNIIDSAGAAPRPPHAVLAAAIDALRECEQASVACGMAMVEAGGMVTEVRRDLDCADVCDATQRVLSRGPATDIGIEAALVQACMLACQASAEACGEHADHYEHCRLHSQAASRCADSLRELASSFDQ